MDDSRPGRGVLLNELLLSFSLDFRPSVAEIFSDGRSVSRRQLPSCLLFLLRLGRKVRQPTKLLARFRPQKVQARLIGLGYVLEPVH